MKEHMAMTKTTKAAALGAAGMIWAALPLAAGAADAAAVQAVTAGPDWTRFENRHEIVAGSALDFSGLGLHHAPAGKYGWLKGDGLRAVFERRPDAPARFYGVNLCNDANYLADDEIERLTDRLVRLGYNAVRLHHHDDMWAKDEDGARAKLDRLMAACIRKGIYLMTDLCVSRKVSWRELGVDRDGLATGVKLRMMTTEAGFACWKKFATDFLTRVNPETGRALKDEPAMPFLVILNEPSPHSNWDKARDVEPFRALWPVWLAETRAQFPGAFPELTDDAFPARGGWWNPNAEANAVSSFWTWCLARFSRRASAFLKEELGVKALLATDNNGPILPEISRTRAACGDFVDFHWYTEHAGSASKKDREESGLPLAGVFRNHNALAGGTYCYGRTAFSRVWGRPLTVSESNMGGPNVNRAVHGLALGAYAAVQDWTGIWTFALAHGARKLFDGCAAPPGRFDLALDPLLQAADRMAIPLFLRGDLPTPAAAFANNFSAADMAPSARNDLSAVPPWGSASSELVWRARLGVSFGETPPPGVAAPGRDARAVAADAAPPAGVAIDRSKGDLAVASPRFAGVFAGADARRDAGALRVRVSGTRACVAAVSLTDAPLETSPRILVWHLTDLHGEGFRWGGTVERRGIGPHTGILSWGDGANLFARTGSAAIVLRLDDAADYDVYALDAVGNRCEKVAAEVRDGQLGFVAAIRPDAPARFYYEVVRRP